MKVLIALDSSPSALHAARSAVELLSPAGADFLVVGVARVPIMWGGVGFSLGAVMPLDIETLAAETETAEATRCVADAEAAGVPDPDVEVVVGDPAHEICGAADRHDVDLIVLGSHDRSLLQRLLAPSVSVGVIRETTRPVLVVPERSP